MVGGNTSKVESDDNKYLVCHKFIYSIPRKVEALFHKGVPVKLNNFTDETLGVSFQNSLQNFLTTF